MCLRIVFSLLFRLLFIICHQKRFKTEATPSDESLLFSAAKVASEVTPYYPVNPLAIWTGNNQITLIAQINIQYEIVGSF